MRRRAASVLLAVALALALGASVLTASPSRAALGPGSFTKHRHPGIGATGPRDYLVYQPTTAAVAPRPLVVFLHGCTQNGTDAAIGSRWTELAERRDLVVVFPEQPTTANGINCWNWFEPAHQARGAGEPAVLAAITAEAVAATGADPSRVYVMGISAGADMAMILGATYPDVYAAVSGHAGCAYVTCTDVTGRLTNTAMGPRARVMPAFLVQGTADPLNDFALGETMVRQWVGANDLADDGAANLSISPVPSKVEHVGFDASALAGVGTVGDPCVRNRQYPCAGALIGAKSYPYSIEHHADRSGCDVVDFWIVQGLSHDYPGGDPAGTFTDPIGPDITTAAADYFARHRLGSPCGGVRAASSSSPAAPGGDGGSGGAPPGGPSAGAPTAPAGTTRTLPATGGTPPAVPAAAAGLVVVLGWRVRLRWADRPAGRRRRRRPRPASGS